MPLHPVSGCKIFVGSAPMSESSSDLTVADFVGVSWIEITKWIQMGDHGDAAQLITADIIGERRTKKQKGTRNAGSMQNIFTSNMLDAGQLALIAYEKTDYNYPVKIELNDMAPGGATNSLRHFLALITQAQETGGSANTLRNLNTMFEINSNIVRVAAT